MPTVLKIVGTHLALLGIWVVVGGQLSNRDEMKVYIRGYANQICVSGMAS